jgi:hypothetical protein
MGTDFTVNSESSAVSRFKLVGGSVNFANSYNVSTDRNNVYIMCLATREIPAGTSLTATLAGVRNPRYEVENAQKGNANAFRV